MSIPYNTFIDYNKVLNELNELQDYMLNDTNIKQSLDTKIQKEPVLKKINNEKFLQSKNTHHIFFPKEKDSLFWCLYIMKNGDVKYELIDYRNFIIEKKIKIEYIEQIRKEKQLVKTYKFSSLINIENNLLNEETLDVKTFLSLCVIENLNVLFIKKKCYFELLMNDTSDLHIVYLLDNKYGYELTTRSDSDVKKSTLFKLDNIEKPIKSISSYKVQDLIDICIKLGAETTNNDTKKNKSKKDLYEAIIQYF